MKTISRVALYCLGLSLLLALTACETQDEVPLPAKEAVILNVADSYFMDFEGVYVAQFEELYPHIMINIVPSVPQSGYDTCPEGYEPGCTEFGDVDVFTLSSADVYRLGELGVMMDLSVLMSESETFDPDDFIPDVMRPYVANGHLVGIPIGTQFFAIYYNRELFERYNVTCPQAGWTREDFLETAQALTHKNDCVFAYDPNGYIAWLTHIDLISYTEQGPVPNFNNPTRVEAFDSHVSLIFEHNVVPTQDQLRVCTNLPGVDRYEISRQATIKGNLAMWVSMLTPASQYYKVNSQWPVGTGIVPLPVHGVQHYYSNSQGLAIAATSKHPEAAWQWIEFISKHYIESMYVPVRMSILLSDAYMQENGEEHVAVIKQALDSGELDFHVSRGEPSEAEAEALVIFNEAVQRMLNGELSPALALDRAQEEAEVLLFPPGEE